MKNIKIILAACLLYAISIFALACCKKKCTDPNNPECSNYDPCWGKTELRADFKIEERIYTGSENGEPKYYFAETDTAVTGVNTIFFTAKATDYDSLKWYLGSEVITTKSFSRMHFPNNQVIPVLLVVWKAKRDTKCNKFTKEVDSVTKTITSIPSFLWNQFNLPSIAHYPMAGTFRGANIDAPLDSFDIKIIDTTSIGQDAFKYTDDFVFANFPKGCGGYRMNIWSYYGGKTFISNFNYIQGYSFTDFTGNSPTYNVNHYGLKSIVNYDKGKIAINYTYDRQLEKAVLTKSWPTNGVLDTISKTYLGYKLN